MNDNDGGFTIVEKSLVTKLHMEIYGTATYERFPIVWAGFPQLRTSYFKLARHIEKVTGEVGLGRTLTKSAKGQPTSRLKITCKSHKLPGKVAFRNIHASPTYMLDGVCRWIAKHLREMLGKPMHLVRDGEEFATQISTFDVRASDVFIKLDIEQFFLSGECYELVADALAHLPDGVHKSTLRMALKFVLDNQWVTSDFDDEFVWRTVKGTGM
jgi:hypothetical protein